MMTFARKAGTMTSLDGLTPARGAPAVRTVRMAHPGKLALARVSGVLICEMSSWDSLAE